MRNARRKRVTVSLPEDVVKTVDRVASASRDTRSGVMTAWLQHEMERREETEYERQIREYYASLTPDERAEDEAESLAWSRAALANWAEQERREEAAEKRRRARTGKPRTRRAPPAASSSRARARP